MKNLRQLLIACTTSFFFVSNLSYGDLYFPPTDGTWENTSPEIANLDPKNIQRAREYAKSKATSSLLIIHKGKIVTEDTWTVTGENGKPSARYTRMHKGDTPDGRPIEDVASVQKSIISVLAGIAVSEKKLDLNKPVHAYLGAGWSKASASQEKPILIRHLMTMTTGLGNRLQYQVPAGTRWRYNTAAYSRMVRVLEKIYRATINDITLERLTRPIFMPNTLWMPRPWAQDSDTANSVGLVTSARDLARLGILILANGKWNDTQILKDPDYLRQSLSTSQPHNMAYGLLWWLNGKESYRRPAAVLLARGSMIPEAPDDMVMASGALGRKLYIVPSQNLVIVRLGDDPGAQFNNEFWSLLVGNRR